MALYELWPRSRLNGWKTYTSPGSLHIRSCPNIILKLLLWQLCFSLKHISFIVSRCGDRLGSGPREWILILRTSLLIQPNTRRHFWSMWWIDTEPKIDIYPSVNPRAHRTTIFSLWQGLQDLVNLLMFYMICRAMMRNTYCRKMWP